MKIKCFMKWKGNNIACICKVDNKKCNCSSCSKGKVKYDQFEGIEECFKNSEKKR